MDTTRAAEEPTPRAIASLVLAILSFFAIPCIGSILAIVLGWGERSQAGRAGLLLGWISLGLSLAGVLLLLLLGGAMVLVSAAS